MLRWFLFCTRVGDLFLYLFEELTGLAVVDRAELDRLSVAAQR
jgi:hypothetical protein